MSGPQRRMLLGFCWGRSRLPANPTKPFTIDSQGGTDDQKLPQSHTCMFQLHLPRYSSKQILRDRLLCAIQDGGSRNSGAMARKPLGDSHSEVPIISALPMPPTLLIDVPADGGHLEDIESFCVRAGVGIASLKNGLSVPDMATLLALKKEDVREPSSSFALICHYVLCSYRL